MGTPRRQSRLRDGIVLVGGYAMVASTVYLLLELTVGWLPFWDHLDIGTWPMRPMVLAAISIGLCIKFVRVTLGEDRRQR